MIFLGQYADIFFFISFPPLPLSAVARAYMRRSRSSPVHSCKHISAAGSYERMSVGSAVLLAWYAVCTSLGDGSDAGARMEFSS